MADVQTTGVEPHLVAEVMIVTFVVSVGWFIGPLVGEVLKGGTGGILRS